jgi:hypothetical protein
VSGSALAAGDGYWRFTSLNPRQAPCGSELRLNVDAIEATPPVRTKRRTPESSGNVLAL